MEIALNSYITYTYKECKGEGAIVQIFDKLKKIYSKEMFSPSFLGAFINLFTT